jgi:hypothetical protein
VFVKLGVSSRAELIRLALERRAAIRIQGVSVVAGGGSQLSLAARTARCGMDAGYLPAVPADR